MTNWLQRAINVYRVSLIGLLSMINELNLKSKIELISLWDELFDQRPPLHLRKEYLIKHISWELQARKSGGYSMQIKQTLENLSEKLSNKKLASKSSNRNNIFNIKAGTRLMREYKGENHTVLALNKGFQYNNKTYNSLSSIANDITGTRWNGKVFFGVKK